MSKASCQDQANGCWTGLSEAQMKAELFPDTEANAEGFNHALLNATMQTVRVALQDDVLNVYRVMRMVPRTI